MLAQVLTLCVPLGLLLLALVPPRWANAHVHRLRGAVVAALGVQLVIAGCFLVPVLFDTQAADTASATVTPLASFIDNLDHYDGVSALMYLLVSFVGLTVSHFSRRYLDGEPTQGNYFRWLGFTLGAVSLLVVAGNLMLFFVAWVMTSVGLHQLLMHYGHRPWAKRAAWTKFVISRVGDVFLLTALLLIYREFGTYHLSEILAAAANVTTPTAALVAVGWLLMLGAITKSAQFPVHFWLPETMEAPTPVSALMHAGIVNAGGYLLIRMSPLVVHAPSALLVLGIVGGFTAVFGAVVMMTQPSVKRSLGYSTIAQMGFMMLQCGLGAFSAAMLHIVAHSLYKAHAFLRSGDVWQVERVPEVTHLKMRATRTAGANQSWWELLAGASFTILAFVLVSGLFGGSVLGKAGGVVLASIVCIALATWISSAARTSWRALGIACGMGVVLIASYLASYALISSIISSLVPDFQSTLALQLLGVVVVTTFVGLAAFQVLLPDTTRRAWLQILYVHASNGFYVDTVVRRALGLSLSRTPSAA